MKYLLILLGLILSIAACRPVRHLYQDPRDGIVYGYVKIKEYYWMTENMRYNMEGSVYNSANPDSSFGRFYDGYQAMEVCPEGWELASMEHWHDLEEKLGVSEDSIYVEDVYKGKEVGKLKSKLYWEEKGTDRYRLNIVPAGVEVLPGDIDYYYMKSTFIWTSTTLQTESGFIRTGLKYHKVINDNQGIVSVVKFQDNAKMSCRCVKPVPKKKRKKKRQNNQ